MDNQKKIRATWTKPGYTKDLPPTERTGYRIGPFGLHKGVRGGWYCDHIPSGCHLSQADARTLAEAERKVRAVLALPIDWNAPDIGERLRHYDDGTGRSITQVIIEACAAA